MMYATDVGFSLHNSVSTRKNYRTIAELGGDNVLRIDFEGTSSHLG